ncbi:MAG: PAS domain-containing protein, partial [Bacteroidales bacterium]|nr:PAS domain-containing protein [Bacteroidales bacterium]
INNTNIKKKKKTKQYVKVKQQDVQEIINFCGNLLWEEDEKKAPVNFSEGSALNDTKSALELLRDDFNELRRKDREQSQNLMNIFESMQVGIVIIEKSTHKIVFANTMAVEMMQTKIDDLIGKKCHTHLCPGQEGECPITDLGKTVENAERILRKSDGTEIQILKNVRSIEFQNTQCLLESFIDISVRKQEEKELLESKWQMQLAIEGGNLGTWDWNMQTDEVQFNERWATMKGYSPEEIEPTLSSWRNLVHSDDLPMFNEVLNAHLEGETGSYEAEFRMKHKSGKWIWILDKGKVFEKNKKGKPIRVCGTHLDITKRKRAEELLIEREQQLRELNTTKDKFFSIIGHDLRSPFNSIIGFSELINKEAKGLDISEIENYAGIISSSAGHTLKLLNNLLEWARMQQGRIVFKSGQLVLNELTKEVLELVADSAGKKSISLINSVKPGISVNADKNMLKTILRNLVSNAIKFTHTGGKVEVSAESKEKEIQVSVSDTGVGIKQENIKELFRIDSEFSTQGTNNEKGTGLGLILCKEFVEKHGGKIGVESKEEKGSTFNFSLPY